MIQGTVVNGLQEFCKNQVHCFPSRLRTDQGRPINQEERGQEATLTGTQQEALRPMRQLFFGEAVEFLEWECSAMHARR